MCGEVHRHVREGRHRGKGMLHWSHHRRGTMHTRGWKCPRWFSMNCHRRGRRRRFRLRCCRGGVGGGSGKRRRRRCRNCRKRSHWHKDFGFVICGRAPTHTPSTRCPCQRRGGRDTGLGHLIFTVDFFFSSPLTNSSPCLPFPWQSGWCLVESTCDGSWKGLHPSACASHCSPRAP